VLPEKIQDLDSSGLFELQSWSWLLGGICVRGNVIRISRELYESLPQIYQVIAQIGEQSGQVVIVEEQPVSKQKKTGHGNGMPAATPDILGSYNVWKPCNWANQIHYFPNMDPYTKQNQYSTTQENNKIRLMMMSTVC
jgi:hypothetical protein